MANTEEKLDKLSERLKTIEQKIDFIMKHFNIKMPPQKPKRAGVW
jgi:tetrahydromethanopterin S-methyltransferase subunit G